MVTRTARAWPLNVAAVNPVTGLPPSSSGIVRFVVSKETALTVATSFAIEYVHTFSDASVHVSAHAQPTATAASKATISLFIAYLLSPALL